MGMGVKPCRKRIQTLLQRSKLPLEGESAIKPSGKGGSPHPCRGLAAVGMWQLGPWLSAGLMDGLHDLRGFYSPSDFMTSLPQTHKALVYQDGAFPQILGSSAGCTE